MINIGMSHVCDVDGQQIVAYNVVRSIMAT